MGVPKRSKIDYDWLDDKPGMKEGLWADLDCPPQIWTPRQGNLTTGQQVIDFAEQVLTQPNQSNVPDPRDPSRVLGPGDPLFLQDYQDEWMLAAHEVDEHGQFRYRLCFDFEPKRSGKGFKVGAKGVHSLLSLPEESEIYLSARNKPQTKNIFRLVAKFIRSNPELRSHFKVYDTETVSLIENIRTGTFLKGLPNDGESVDGISPSLIICDEIHRWPNHALWHVFTESLGSRPNAQIWVHSTAGDGNDREHIGWKVWERCVEVYNETKADPSNDNDVLVRIWSAPNNCDVADPRTWLRVNPGAGKTFPVSDLYSSFKNRTSDASFKRLRLNMWTTSEDRWNILPYIEACTKKVPPLRKGDVVTVGFDGAYTHDCSALVAYRGSDRSFHVLELWERPDGADDTWVVDDADIDDAMFYWASELKILRISADPAHYRHQISTWQSKGLPILSFPQSPARMIPATAAYEKGWRDEELCVDEGETAFFIHHSNCWVKQQRSGGVMVSKERRSSDQPIDIVPAAIMAYDTWLELHSVVAPKPSIHIW